MEHPAVITLKKSLLIQISCFLLLALVYVATRSGMTTTVTVIQSPSQQSIAIFVDRKLLQQTTIPSDFSFDHTTATFLEGVPLFPVQRGVIRNVIQTTQDTQEATIVLQNGLNTRLEIFNAAETMSLQVHVRPFMNLDWGTDFIEGSNKTHLGGGYGVSLRWVETLKLLCAIALAWLPFALPVLIVYWILLSFSGNMHHRADRVSPALVMSTLGLLLALFAWEYYLTTAYLESIPHVPDSVSYVMQAKMLARGKFYEHPALFPRYFNSFNVGGMMYKNGPGIFPERTVIPEELQRLPSDNGKWFTQYPIGHPLLLAIGVLLHHLDSMPALIGTAFLFFLILLGKEIVGRWLYGISAALCAFISPFFQMNAASFMSHNSATLYLTASVYFLFTGLRIQRKKTQAMLLLLLSGITWGLLFNTRPLSATGLCLPFFLYIILFAVRYKTQAWRFGLPILCFGVGAAALVGIFLLQNASISGSPFIPPYTYMGTFSSSKLGFTNGHTLEKGLQHSLTNLAILSNVLYGWSPYLTFLFAGIACIIGAAQVPILFCLLSILSLAAVWTLYDGNFIMYGPRFYYEMLPFLSLLTSYGIWVILERSYHTIRHTAHLPQRKLLKLAAGVLLISVLGLFGWMEQRTVLGWYAGKEALYPVIDFTPQTISDLYNFNSANATLITEAKKENLHQAIIFVLPCDQWWCDNVPFSQNDITLDGDIIWARDSGSEAKNKELMEHFPTRRYYHGNYDSGSITPYAIPQ